MELSSLCREDEYSSLLKRSDLPLNQTSQAVTLDQLVRLFQLARKLRDDGLLNVQSTRASSIF